jgi:hypothetical protein
MVRLHFFVEIVGPGVFQGQDVEKHRWAAVDDAFRRECGFRLVAIQYELAVSESDGGRGHFNGLIEVFGRVCERFRMQITARANK